MSLLLILFLVSSKYLRISTSQEIQQSDVAFMYSLLKDKIIVLEQKFELQLNLLQKQQEEDFENFRRKQEERLFLLETRLAERDENNIGANFSDEKSTRNRHEMEIETLKSDFLVNKINIRSIQIALFEQKSFIKNNCVGNHNKASGRLEEVQKEKSYQKTTSADTSEHASEKMQPTFRNGVQFSGISINRDDIRIASDCSQIYQMGYRSNGVYRIHLSESEDVDVKCNLKESTRNWNMIDSLQHLKGWTVVQNRRTASNFNRTWAEYKNGFGNFQSDFWLGNYIFYKLVNGSKNHAHLFIRFYAHDYMYYYRILAQSIKMEDENSSYKISYAALSYANNIVKLGIPKRMNFTTHDRPVKSDDRCPEVDGGWWRHEYPLCINHSKNPNSKYALNESMSAKSEVLVLRHEGLNIIGSEMLLFVDNS